MGDPVSLLVACCWSKNRYIFLRFFNVNWNAFAMFRYVGVEPDVSRLFNSFASKNTILKCIFQDVLDDTEAQTVISLSKREYGTSN